jgi:hypothetical protein
LKVTVPVGGFGGVAEGVVTLAVKVTGWPYVEGFADDANATLVA